MPLAAERILLASAELPLSMESPAIRPPLKPTPIRLKTWQPGSREPVLLLVARSLLPVACRSAPMACNRTRRAAMRAMPSRADLQQPLWDMAALHEAILLQLQPLPVPEPAKTIAPPIKEPPATIVAARRPAVPPQLLLPRPPRRTRCMAVAKGQPQPLSRASTVRPKRPHPQ